MDPLSVLREYTMRNELDRVTIVGDNCCFGNEYRFPRAVETAYRRRGGDRYNLESLLLFVQCKALKHTDYMQRARGQNMQIVTFTDRKQLLEYLEGHLQTTDAIDLIAPIALPPSAPASAGPPASLPSSGAAASAAPGALGQGAHGSTSAVGEGAAGPGGLGGGEAGDPARKRSRWDTDKGASGVGGEGGAAGAAGGAGDGFDAYGKRQRTEGSQAGLGTGRGMGYHADAGRGVTAAGVTVGGVGLGGGGMSEAEEREAIGELMRRERPVRDRETVLLCPKRKDAFAAVLAMLNRREHERKKLDQAQREASKRHHPSGPSSSRPSRDGRGAAAASGAGGGGGGGGGGGRDERQVWREYMGTDALEELGIDPTQSSYVQHGKGAGSGSGAVPGAAGGGSQVKPTDGQLVRSQPPNPAPSSRHARPHGNQSQHRQHSSSGSGAAAAAAGAAGGSSTVPIILVPSAAQTLINIFNVKEFLEDGNYLPAEDKARAAGGKRPDMVVLQRRMGREKAVVYHVRDRPEGMSKRDWERVAAVFVLGKEWQFKGWPFKDHVEILSKVMGVFMRFEDDSVESAATVRQWNCNILPISKYKRHQDRTAALNFWDRLDKFLAARKCALVY